jgi:hypothetical protein
MGRIFADCLEVGRLFLKITEVAQIAGQFFHGKSDALI